MLKTAVIFEDSPFDRKGRFNAVHNRIIHLAATGECTVDPYCLHSIDSALVRRFRHTVKVPHKKTVEVDGMRYRMLWYRFSLLDWFLTEKLHRPPCLYRRFVKRILPRFKDYDVIIAHSYEGAVLAYEINKAYGIPFYITWHGSDIHTHPMRSPLVLRMTAAAMDAAECNFFVSRTLMAASDAISETARKSVLYNGASEDFRRFQDEERQALRKEYGVSEDDKVVAFVGNLVNVKNAAVLPHLFHRIAEEYEGMLKFWIIGDGKLRGEIEPQLLADASVDVGFLGNRPAEEMPRLMNCIDVLVLPSLNEGLPLVTIEALKCGANVVGSYAGGIPEVIGRDFCVPLSEPPSEPADSRFVNSFAVKVASILAVPKEQTLAGEFSWETTAYAELSAMARHIH